MLFITGRQMPENSIAGEDLPPNRFVTVRDDGRVYLAQNKKEIWSISTNYTLRGNVAKVADQNGMYKMITRATKFEAVN